MTTHYFRIADHDISISFAQPEVNNMSLLPAFASFERSKAGANPLFTLLVDDTIRPEKERKLVRKFDTGNGDTVVYQLPDGGYQYIVRDTRNRDCCLIITNEHFSECRCALNGDWVMRSFGLNDALMLIFAFAGSFHQTLLVHASCVMVADNDTAATGQGTGYTAFPFTAKSGVGKSTHTSMWLKYIENAELLNDDNPVVRVIDGIPYIYGSPWSGKTPCYRDRKARLGAFTRIERAPKNYIERLKTLQAFASLLPACSTMKWDSAIYDNICNAVTAIIGSVPVYTMHCLPDREAAMVCHETLCGASKQQ